MSIPLDRLYTHLLELCNHDVVISCWHPHGSKNLDDLSEFNSWPDHVSPSYQFGTVCHDQEPLMFSMYSAVDMITSKDKKDHGDGANCIDSWPELTTLVTNMNLRFMTSEPFNFFDKTILIHSELNSVELEKYITADFLPVYWWSHAAIAQDWYRYAQHDQGLPVDHSQFDKDFLVYARAWTGARQYRLNFLNHIKQQDLAKKSKINFSAVDNDIHYSTLAKDLQIDLDFEQHFSPNVLPSSASADYCRQDYEQCAFELVLETVFESSRIHLTEKTLRPIACGKPFLLAAGPSSLKLLKRYGFETFAPWIDESYDSEPDINLRTNLIVAEMKRLCNLDVDEKIKVWQQTHAIAERNRQWFFSKQFAHMIFEEFQINFETAYQELQKHCTKKYLSQAVELAGSHKHGDWLLGTFYEIHERSNIPSQSLDNS